MHQLPQRRTMTADITWLTDRIATGADLYAEEPFRSGQLADWLAQGVTHIIDCRQEHSDEEYVARIAPWVRYMHNGIDDRHGYVPPSVAFGAAAVFASAALSDPHAKVLIHCHMGINRGPSQALAVLLETTDLTPIEAFDLIRERRPFVGLAYAAHAVAARVEFTDDPVTEVRRFAAHQRRVMDADAQMAVYRAIHGLRAQETAC